MKIRGKQTIVRGAILFALADTLAAHRLGGFKIVSLRKCRMCQISVKVNVCHPIINQPKCQACTAKCASIIIPCINPNAKLADHDELHCTIN